MASFKGSSKIILNEGDAAVAFRFELTQCSSISSNDGFLPYGLDSTSVEVYGYAEDGTNVTDIMVESRSLLNNVVTVALNYPGEAGKYVLHFKIYLSNGSTILNATFDRCFATDKIY
jgi:hypothetical protein